MVGFGVILWPDSLPDANPHSYSPTVSTVSTVSKYIC